MAAYVHISWACAASRARAGGDKKRRGLSNLTDLLLLTLSSPRCEPNFTNFTNPANQDTALHRAAAAGAHDLARLLYRYGADPHRSNALQCPGRGGGWGGRQEREGRDGEG